VNRAGFISVAYLNIQLKTPDIIASCHVTVNLEGLYSLPVYANLAWVSLHRGGLFLPLPPCLSRSFITQA